MTTVRMMRAMRRESGVLLLTVALLLAVMAALAVGLNRAAGMDLQSVSAEYDRRSAAYLADAAFAAAKWKNQAKCASDNLDAMSLGDGTISASVTKGKAHQIAINATGTTATRLSRTVTRDKVDIYNFGSTETKDLGGGIQDTYIYANQGAAMNADKSLVLADQSNALLSWTTTDIPKDSEVLKATLTLVQNGGSGTQRTVNLHRVTTQWDASATWTRARPLVGWTGGDYDPQVIASTVVTGSGTYSMDLTMLTDAWYNKVLSNYGMLLRLPNPGQSVTFYSHEAASNQQPDLTVTFSKLCP